MRFLQLDTIGKSFAKSLTPSRKIGTIVLVIALYMYYRNRNKKKPYNDSGSYKNVTPMKHDLLKDMTI